MSSEPIMYRGENKRSFPLDLSTYGLAIFIGDKFKEVKADLDIRDLKDRVAEFGLASRFAEKNNLIKFGIKEKNVNEILVSNFDWSPKLVYLALGKSGTTFPTTGDIDDLLDAYVSFDKALLSLTERRLNMR